MRDVNVSVTETTIYYLANMDIIYYYVLQH